MDKKAMITAILQVYAVSNDYGADEVFLGLVFLDESALRTICQTLYINPDD